MLDDLFWDTLLVHIESGQVVPIVGQGLLQVESAGQAMSLQRFLAGRLATDFKIPAGALTPDSTVSDIFCHPDFPRAKRNLAYARLQQHLDAAALAPPEALRQLASIRSLNVFISTTFDNLLVRAINAERFGGEPRTRVINYTYREVNDLPPPQERGDDVIVYHLFGQAAPMPYFAVTEADYLEFFNALLGERARVRNLTELLDQRDLLFLGTAFPDWLSRFLLRFAKRGPLSTQRDFNEVFADATTRHDPHFVSFVGNFSQQTLVYEEGSAAEFVAELHRRWLLKHPPAPKPAPVDSRSPVAAAGGAGSGTAQNGTIFISYATENFAEASRLRDQLTAAGAVVWFDKKADTPNDTLVPGDDYTRKIVRSIESCAVFLPVISRAVSDYKGRFFRFEWATAIGLQPYYKGLESRFIMPVIVDDTAIQTMGVPDEFKKLHVVRAVNGELSRRDCDSIVQAAQSVRGTVGA